MDSGMAEDDAYNIYSKPLFQGSSANVLYRPRKDVDSDTYGGGAPSSDEKGGRFRPDRGFEGTSASSSAVSLS